MPVWQEDDFRLFESRAILKHVSEGSSLYPGKAKVRYSPILLQQAWQTLYYTFGSICVRASAFLAYVVWQCASLILRFAILSILFSMFAGHPYVRLVQLCANFAVRSHDRAYRSVDQHWVFLFSSGMDPPIRRSHFEAAEWTETYARWGDYVAKWLYSCFCFLSFLRGNCLHSQRWIMGAFTAQFIRCAHAILLIQSDYRSCVQRRSLNSCRR